MSNTEANGLSEEDISTLCDSTVLKVRVNGDIHDATNVIRELQGRMMRPQDYSIMPGDLYGTHVITVSIPERSPSLANINQLDDPHNFLAKNPAVLDVSDVRNAARRHIRLLTNPNEPDAILLAEAVVGLG